MTRKYGTGSLYQRRSDGRWIGRLPDGRGGYEYTTGVERDEVRRRLDEMRKERDRRTSGTRPRGGERVRDLIARYQATVDPLRSRPKTLATNAMAARDHINPAIGSIRVAQLELDDVQRMVDRMIAAGRSPKTVRNTVSILRTILTHAMREGDLDRNVASLAILPEIRRERLPSLTTAQLTRFIEETRGHPLWPAWVLLATTGMRASEMLGLRWSDLGPADTTAAIDGTFRTVVRRDETGRPLGTAFVRQATKTPKSRRTVHLPRLAREAIAVQRAQATSVVVVFARESGAGPMNLAMVNRAFHDELRRLGLPVVRLHSLRHSAAVAMLDGAAGDIRAVSAALGHSKIGTTVDVYGQDADAARKRAASAMDRVMGRKAR